MNHRAIHGFPEVIEFLRKAAVESPGRIRSAGRGRFPPRSDLLGVVICIRFPALRWPPLPPQRGAQPPATPPDTPLDLSGQAYRSRIQEVGGRIPRFFDTKTSVDHNSRINPEAGKVLKIAQTLDVSVEELYGVAVQAEALTGKPCGRKLKKTEVLFLRLKPENSS